jgi:hypothetical protein
MAHYALLDENNIVTNVIVGEDEGFDGKNWEHEYFLMFNQTCKRTSYNTFAGEHNDGGTPFRKNYAVIGGIYDKELDAFYESQPYPSWSLDTDKCIWMPPVPEPRQDGYIYRWNEELGEWYEEIRIEDPSNG